jgi:hypothetical protein
MSDNQNNWKHKVDALDVALVAGIVLLAMNGVDGWGWLTFVLIIRN